MNDTSSHPQFEDDSIDFGEIFSRLKRGLPLIAGLASLGLAIAATAYFAVGPYLSVLTSTRVIFSFAGYEKGEYPDKSRFQPDDLRSPEIVTEALKRQGLATTEEYQGIVRAALVVEGIIPTNITKERDKARAAGLNPPAYRPDEYTVSLNLPRKFPLGNRQRELLLNSLISIYRENFQKTYSQVPIAFGNAFESLKDADLFDYELVLNQEIQSIIAYLNQQTDVAKTFRSPTTNLSFSDLLKQTEIFNQVRLNETLGRIRLKGLSRDRQSAIIKIDYYLRALTDQEQRALEEEKVIKDLLEGTSLRTQGYVLGVKAQATMPRENSLLLDQNLIDSLLAHDAYNYLMREALKAGLTVKRIQSEKSVASERKKMMEANMGTGSENDLNESISQVVKALNAVEKDYLRLLKNIRKTHEEFANQAYGDAIRMSMQAVSDSFYRGLAMAGIAGLGIGLAAGLGLALLGVAGRKPAASRELK